ncbi:MAG: N-formylglutamate amidohydrolase [Psychroserpens sp.]|uniref:N-formylglutamate amidohydrolase n=1 Tax=Psychroserpens sp. TaxID=2020870 RepID=UPI003C846288
MKKLSIDTIISKIQNEECFHAVANDYSLTLKIDRYVNYACAAVHDGHQFRKPLWDNCLHTEYERWYEEDPETKSLVASHPIVLAGRDSRFEYDLNRPPEEAVFVTAWGKELWREPLSKDEKKESLEKHSNFYRVTHALMAKLEEKFGMAIVYDMHSYNWKRWEREVPTWNLGTSNIDNKRFGTDIELWRKSLAEIKFPREIKSTAKINDTFQGNGYFLKYITQNFKNTLVLATEIAKIYGDEYEYVLYPEIIATVEKQLRNRIPEHAAQFYRAHSPKL